MSLSFFQILVCNMDMMKYRIADLIRQHSLPPSCWYSLSCGSDECFHTFQLAEKPFFQSECHCSEAGAMPLKVKAVSLLWQGRRFQPWYLGCFGWCNVNCAIRQTSFSSCTTTSWWWCNCIRVFIYVAITNPKYKSPRFASSRQSDPGSVLPNKW